MNLKIGLLFSILLSSCVSSAASIVFEPLKVGLRRGYFVASKDYEDLRLIDHSGNVAYWMVKSKNLKVEQFFKNGKLEEFKSIESKGTSSKEISYVALNGKMMLAKAVLRRNFNMAGTILRQDSLEVMCKAHASLSTEFNKIATSIDFDKCDENIEAKMISPNCKKVFSPPEYKNLVKAYSQSLVLPEDNNRALKCLGEANTLNTIAEACQVKNRDELKTELEVVALRYKLHAAKLSQAPEQIESKVVCDEIKKDSISALTDEDGKTTFFNASNAQAISSKDMEKIVFDELLHVAGVKDQTIVTNLINVCFEKSPKIDCEAAKKVELVSNNKKKDGNSRFLFNDADRRDDVGNKAASESNAKITTKDLSASVPQTLAKVEGPTPQAVAQEAVASSRAYVSNTSMTGETSEGQKQAILRSSLAMTQGPLNTAAKVMKLAGASLSTANANTTSAPKVVEAPTFDRGSASQQVPASVRGSSDESLPLKQTGSLSASVDSANSGGSAGSAGARSPASELGVSRGDAGASGGGAVARSGSPRSSGGSASSGYASGSSGSNGKRSPANANRISEEQQKLARMIEQAAYDRVQSQLTKKEFVRMLEQNNITILKLDGTPPKGATKGDIIYIDRPTEGKFVRQK